MNREMILAMSAGRELDVLIALKIMGWRWVPYIWYDGTTKTVLVADGWTPHGDDFDELDDGNKIFWNMPTFSIDISSAWEVLEKFPTFQVTRMHDVELPWAKEEMYRATINKNKNVAHAKTAPLAICRAALIAELDSARSAIESNE